MLKTVEKISEKLFPRISLTDGASPLFELMRVYANALTDKKSLYDYAWHVLYSYLVKRENINFSEVEDRVNRELERAREVAQNYWDSVGLLILLGILHRENIFSTLNWSGVRKWMDEVERYNFYLVDDRTPPAEFLGFSYLFDPLKERIRVLSELETEMPSHDNIITLLYIYFVKSLTDDVKGYVENIVNNYRGIIKWLEETKNVEALALYLYLVAEAGFQSEADRVYSVLEKIFLEEFINVEWIAKAIREAKISGKAIIHSEELSFLYPKILYISMIAIQHAGYSTVLVSSPELKKAFEKIKKEDLVGIEESFVLKYKLLSIYSMVITILFSSTLTYIVSGSKILSVIIPSCFTAILLILRKLFFKDPEIIRLVSK